MLARCTVRDTGLGTAGLLATMGLDEERPHVAIPQPRDAGPGPSRLLHPWEHRIPGTGGGWGSAKPPAERAAGHFLPCNGGQQLVPTQTTLLRAGGIPQGRVPCSAPPCTHGR